MLKKNIADIGMPSTFVILNVEKDRESEVLDELRSIPEVKEAYRVYSVYDIIAKIEAPTTDELKEVITWKIRRLEKVESTLTLVIL